MGLTLSLERKWSPKIKLMDCVGFYFLLIANYCRKEVPMNEPIKMWYAHTTEHYSPLERKEILTHATTWVNSEDVMLRESRPPKGKYCLVPCI